MSNPDPTKDAYEDTSKYDGHIKGPRAKALSTKKERGIKGVFGGKFNAKSNKRLLKKSKEYRIKHF